MSLLASQSIVRVVFQLDGLPMAYPVNIAVRDGDVFFVSAPGGKLEKALTGSVMAIEADSWDPESRTGWSVLVTGHAEAVTDYALEQSIRSELDAWVPGQRDFVVRIRGTYVSGRRIPHRDDAQVEGPTA